MEYRRRRRHAKSRGRRNERESGSAGGALIMLLLVAGIIYAAVSSSVGDFVADKVIAPVSAFLGLGGEAEATPAATDYTPVSGTDIDLTEGDAAPVSADVTLPATSCYMLQMGVFSSRENADAMAEELRSRGAAGYIIEDDSSGDTLYRVMAAGYEDEASAKSVKQRLVDEGNDCTVYTLESAGADFRVTAPEASLAGIEAGFSSLAAAKASMAEAVIGFDKNAMSVSDGKAEAKRVLETLEGDMEALSSYAPDGGTLSQILDAYSKTKASLSSLVDGEYESNVDFSAAMKYTYLYISDACAALSDGLAG